MSTSLTIDTGSIINQIAAKIQARPSYVTNVLNLLKEGGTVPFIARYRKEQTGSMDETEIRTIKENFENAYKTEERRITVIQSIRSQDKLTPELEKKIIGAKTLTEIEDLYLPYKPKRKTLATKALEKGLGPLAELIKEQITTGDRKKILKQFYEVKKPEEEATEEGKKKKKTKDKDEDKEQRAKSEKEALDGAIDIIAEEVGNTAEFRKYVREICFERSSIVSHVAKKYEHLLKTEEQKRKEKEEEERKAEEEAKRQEEENKKSKEKAEAKTKNGEKESLTSLSHDAIRELIKKQEMQIKKKEIARKKKLEEELLKKQKKELGIADEFDGSKALGKKEADPLIYQMYFDFTQEAKEIPPHRILAINRGEKEKVLDVHFENPDNELLNWVKSKLITVTNSIFLEEYVKAIEYGYKRYIIRAIERELKSEITTKAEDHAIQVFAKNLSSLLMQPPIKERPIIGIDPGYRTGCKVAVIDRNGKFLDHDVIYPVPPKNAIAQAKNIIMELSQKYNAKTVAIGNGTASRETESFVAGLSKIDPKIEYAIVSEAGASVYSASEIAKEEFPKLDLTVRGAISIARRLQDPLSELIKIDPKSIGVGLYQHDVNQISLKKELDAVIEDCVNKVGVLINSASYKLLEYVSGLNKRLARAIYDHRNEHGQFKNREEIRKISGLGDKTYEQCAGFLKILDGDNPLDATNIHPESYWIVEKILEHIGEKPSILADHSRKSDLAQKIKMIKPKELIEFLGKDIGMPTLKDIVMGLLKPDRDPRDDLPAPILRKDILKLEDLKPEMILKGTVRNVVDFGAFVDIGVKYDGLVHISEIVNPHGGGFISDPTEVLHVGDVIDVRLISIRKNPIKIQLTMRLDTNTQKKEGENEKGRSSNSFDLNKLKSSGNIIIREKKKKR